uniref:Uncharacterized protein n=1 Tax=Anguilla anguilla TaxID=7936 RepID=A0A0E9QGJ2_ANGAN
MMSSLPIFLQLMLSVPKGKESHSVSFHVASKCF